MSRPVSQQGARRLSRRGGRINIRLGQGYRQVNFEDHWPDRLNKDWHVQWDENDLATLSTPGTGGGDNDNQDWPYHDYWQNTVSNDDYPDSPAWKYWLAGVVGGGAWVLYDFLDNFDWMLELGDTVDTWMLNPREFTVSGGGWYLHQDCGIRPGAPPYTPGNIGPVWNWRIGHTSNCLAGQAPSATSGAWPADNQISSGVVGGIAPTNETLMLSDRRNNSGLVRDRNDVTWWRDPGSWPETTLRRLPWQRVRVRQKLNPNLLRQLPSPKPEVFPDSAPAPRPEVIPSDWLWQSRPGARPHQRTLPRPRVRENKNMSKAARVGIFLWRLMDTVSELSEIAGAFWEALPDDVKKRWDCGGTVQIGQYGSDVNACMVDALWHNWHRVDANEAFLNVAKNVAEDMTIGAFHKYIGDLYPGFSLDRTKFTSALAQSDPELYIAEALKALFEAVGLEEEE